MDKVTAQDAKKRLQALAYDAQQRLTACIRDDIRIVLEYLEVLEALQKKDEMHLKK